MAELAEHDLIRWNRGGRLMVNLGPIELLVMIVVTVGLVVWPAWRICSKAGFPGALSLLVLLPIFNLFLLFFLAFAEWPALRVRQEKSTSDF
jgi:hypothetical protein